MAAGVAGGAGRERAPLPWSAMKRFLVPVLAGVAALALVEPAGLRAALARGGHVDRPGGRARRAAGRREPRAAAARRERDALARRPARQGRRPELLGLVVRALQGRGAGARGRPAAPAARRHGHRPRRDVRRLDARLAEVRQGARRRLLNVRDVGTKLARTTARRACPRRSSSIAEGRIADFYRGQIDAGRLNRAIAKALQ